MNRMKRFHKIYLLTMLFSLSVLLSCSDNAAGPDEGPSGSGQASFTISGDISGQKTGRAEFYSFSALGVHLWSIDVFDVGPSTFELSFQRIGTSPISRPAPGNYSISSDFLDSSKFSAIYTHVTGNNATEYTPIFSDLCSGNTEEGGTLTIENSSDDRVSGKFEFTASDTGFDELGNCEVLGTITVKGEFDAKRTTLK